MTTTIAPGPRSPVVEHLLDELGSHPIWTELRAPVIGEQTVSAKLAQADQATNGKATVSYHSFAGVSPKDCPYCYQWNCLPWNRGTFYGSTVEVWINAYGHSRAPVTGYEDYGSSHSLGIGFMVEAKAAGE